jgi:hypothetical protein
MVEVTIQRLGHLGDGIGTGPGGQAVYAARTLPGEVVAGEIEGDRIETPAIVTPSPERVSAHCVHYRSCGGCALMHASESFVAQWKARRHRNRAAGAGSGGTDAAHRDLPVPVAAARHAGGTADEERGAGGLPRAAVGHHRADHRMPRADARSVGCRAGPRGDHAPRRISLRRHVLRHDTDRQRRGPAGVGGQTARRATPHGAGRLFGELRAADMGG